MPGARVPGLSGCPRRDGVRTVPRMATRVPYRPLPLDQTDVVYDHGPDSVRREEDAVWLPLQPASQPHQTIRNI